MITVLSTDSKLIRDFLWKNFIRDEIQFRITDSNFYITAYDQTQTGNEAVKYIPTDVLRTCRVWMTICYHDGDVEFTGLTVLVRYDEIRNLCSYLPFAEVYILSDLHGTFQNKPQKWGCLEKIIQSRRKKWYNVYWVHVNSGRQLFFYTVHFQKSQKCQNC